MSFKAKKDFCGLVDGTSIVLKSHEEGRKGSLATCANDEGDVVDVTDFGHVMDPSNSYALKADVTNLTITLGKVTTVNFGTDASPANRHFMLKSVSIGTSNSGEVSISSQSEEVPEAAAKRTYTVTIPKLRCRNKAQILDSLFTLTGEKAHLQKADYTFSVESTITTVDGERVTWDVYGGKVECSVEAKQAGSALPTFEAGSSETLITVLTGDNSESRPDSDYSTVKATITRYLKLDAEG